MGGEWLMELFTLYISYVSWGNDGKHRPVLVFALKDETVYVYPITSKYESKSEAIQARYFKINDWEYAGLDRLSYVDTKKHIPIPISALKIKTPIGKLSAEDKKRLMEFSAN